MKLNILLLLTIVGCVFAEDKNDGKPNLVEEWKAIYGNYGVDAYYPLRYQLARYSYPVIQPSYPLVQPSYPLVQPSYPIYQPAYPIYQPAKPVVTLPSVRVKASYDPEYFNDVYGFYPAV